MSTMPSGLVSGERPSTSILDLIGEHARATPHARAVTCENRSLSWAELRKQIERTAAAFTALQVGRGDKVATLSHTSIEHLVSLLGALRAGACVVPLATSASAGTLKTMIQDSDAKVLLVSEEMRPSIASIEADLIRHLSGRVVAFDFAAPGWRNHADWLASAPPEPPMLAIDFDDAFNIIYSSGTTGQPKGILHDHGTRFRQAIRRNYDFDPNSVLLLSTPLYSNTTMQPLFAAIAHGARTILMRKFDAARYLEICASERVTHTMLVPVQYQRILAHSDFGSFDLSAFKLKQSTGAPLDAELKGEILARWPGRMIDVYGMTEGGNTCILDIGKHPHKLATVGCPAPDHDIRIIDGEGREVPRGDAGEIVGRSPFMMAGYYKQPEKTEELYWRDRDGRVFHRSGDIGRFDEDGFVILLDRKKDVIISGGFNIYASDLESVLSRHPDVADVAVIGIPSEAWGETPLALVVLRPGREVSSVGLCDWANAQLGKTQRLSAVEFRDELPRSSLGKLVKRDLRAPYWK